VNNLQRHVADIREIRNNYKILVRNAQGNITAGRLRHRWESDNKIVLKEIWCKGEDEFKCFTMESI
jgi:hypothetical protein